MDNPLSIAAVAELTWCSDQEEGILRVRTGKGFAYKGKERKAVKDVVTLDRIKALAIPPAWTDVWIAPHADCHIQATGRDARRRKQYRYHEKWTQVRGEAKFSTLPAFCAALPGLRKAVQRDLRKRTVSREKVLATIIWLLDNTMIRVGNRAYAKENGNFGLTTLRNRHANIRGSTLQLSFKGKSGKVWNLRVTDRRIVNAVRRIQELPGQTLFQYLDDEGMKRAVGSQDVNDYIREHSGGNFTSKHFRTWAGTVLAASLFGTSGRPDSQAGRKRLCNDLVDQVARRLGNTRAVCRACYIHPCIIPAWETGQLADGLQSARKATGRTPAGLERAEAIVKRWLEEQAATL